MTDLRSGKKDRDGGSVMERNKSVLVTAGADGVGLAIAKKFASE